MSLAEVEALKAKVEALFDEHNSNHTAATSYSILCASLRDAMVAQRRAIYIKKTNKEVVTKIPTNRKEAKEI